MLIPYKLEKWKIQMEVIAIDKLEIGAAVSIYPKNVFPILQKGKAWRYLCVTDEPDDELITSADGLRLIGSNDFNELADMLRGMGFVVSNSLS